MSHEKDWRPITPAKVIERREALERGTAWTGFLGQLIEAHRELYESTHGSEPDPTEQLPLF